ncbi:GNAT family N-acetyltransferase [Streptomyces sp. NRRL B-24484]|uniref:GNAT family N-acetyltransferase n=1 Tax=Streptomyces sp. NRRL B-24484 TaxID=1463833 RepID=UPI0004BF92F9|nr:GNAT family N-acetyltransferase [Streptomyces sp. NRRL B-24484]
MTAATPGDRPEIHREPGTLDGELADGWRRLVAADPHGSWFGTPEWVLSWWETLGTADPAADRAEIAVWRGPEGGVEAVVPLLRTRLRLHPRLPLTARCLTLLGSGPGAADHCGPAVAAHRREDVRGWLAARARRTTLWLPDLDPAAAAALPAAARPVARSACPRADLTGGHEALGSRQFRSTVRRYRRKLEAAGVAFRWVPPAEVRPAHLDAVLDLHRLRRAALGRPTTFDGRRRPLHLRLLERSAATTAPGGEGPAFCLAEHEGRTVGALYGFRWNGAFAYYQIGWDVHWAPLRLGTVLISETVRACAEQGLHTFDFLRGTEPYKYRFGAVDRHDTTLLLPHGPTGALLALKHRLKGGGDRPAGAVRNAEPVPRSKAAGSPDRPG